MPTAFFAGRFDPITNGHLDIALRAAELFEHVVVVTHFIELNNDAYPN